MSWVAAFAAMTKVAVFLRPSPKKLMGLGTGTSQWGVGPECY